MPLFIVLILALAVFFNLRALAGRHPDAHWARMLFRPFGPRTDVNYMTRRELFRSSLESFALATGLTAFPLVLGYALGRLSRCPDAVLILFLVVLLAFSILAILFLLSGIALAVRGLFRRSSYMTPRPAAADVEHTPYLMIDQSWYRKPAGLPEHVSCGGVVIRRDEDKLFVALIREDGFAEFILPKGHVELGETLEQAAIREITEESGLADLSLVSILGVRQRLNLKKTSWGTMHYFLFTTKQIHGTPTDIQHSYVLIWFPLDALPRMFWPEQQELIETSRGRIKELVAQ